MINVLNVTNSDIGGCAPGEANKIVYTCVPYPRWKLTIKRALDFQHGEAGRLIYDCEPYALLGGGLCK